MKIKRKKVIAMNSHMYSSTDNRYRFRHLLVSILLLASFCYSSQVFASDKLSVEYPTVDAGEAEIGMHMMALSDGNPNINNAQTRKLGAGYGFSNIWSSELSAEYDKAANSSTVTVQAYEWENMLRLTAPGRDWADWAMILEYSYSVDRAEQDAVQVEPIMQKRFQDHILTVNLSFDRNPSENDTNHWQLGYAWQYLWRGNPAFRFALEGYGQVGDYNHWSATPAQSHQIGPAVVGKIHNGDDSDMNYRLGIYFGVTQGAPNRALMAGMEYEF